MSQNTNSRHWFLTWETNKLQKKLPSHFILTGVRKSKRAVLELFKECFRSNNSKDT